MTAATLVRIYVSEGGAGALWCRVPQFYDRVMRERRAEGWSAHEQTAERARLLVLDEGRRQHRRQRQLDVENPVDQLVGELLSRRHRDQRLTVVTTNRQLGDLGDAAVESRIREGCYVEMGSEYGDFRDWRPE